MNDIARTRESLFLSQTEFASYLGVTRTLLSMAETGRRKLPEEADKKVSQIYIEYSKMNSSKKKVNHARVKQEQFILERRVELNLEAEYSEALLKRLERKLKVAEEKYDKLLNCLLIWESLVKKESKGSRYRKDTELQVDRTNLQLRDCGPAFQIELKEKINLHASRAALRRSLLSKIEG